MSLQDAYKHEKEYFKHALVVQREFITPLTNPERRCGLKKDFDPLSNKSKQICVFIEQGEYNVSVSNRRVTDTILKLEACLGT